MSRKIGQFCQLWNATEWKQIKILKFCLLFSSTYIRKFQIFTKTQKLFSWCINTLRSQPMQMNSSKNTLRGYFCRILCQWRHWAFFEIFDCEVNVKRFLTPYGSQKMSYQSSLNFEKIALYFLIHGNIQKKLLYQGKGIYQGTLMAVLVSAYKSVKFSFALIKDCDKIFK